ncbi:MAG: hypothetical protein NC411_06250 [Bacteroides sp.]|nr:hypothetical protein [Bacteroides sp.]
MKNLVILFIACILALLCACGSNGEVNGKEYIIDCSPIEFINTIKSIKEKHPEYDLMHSFCSNGTMENHDKYVPNKDRPTWMYFHFCLPINDTIVIIKTEIYLSKTPTSFYLLGRTYDKDFRGSEQFRNLPDKERQEIQTVFESLVIDEIRKKHDLIEPESKLGKQLKEFGEWLNYKLTNLKIL